MSVSADTVATDPSAELAALIGARICHDLVSPVGAIANGVELLSLTGGAAAGPELALVAESCASAEARLRFYRVAFGTREVTDGLPPTEATRLAESYLADTRLALDWQVEAALTRGEVQLGFLALMCAGAALPRGGAVRVRRVSGRWRVTAEAPRVAADMPLWARLSAPGTSGAITPGQVEFLLLGLRAAEAGRRPESRLGDRDLALTV